MENITPGYYWAKQKQYKDADPEIVEVFEMFKDFLSVDMMGRGDCFNVEDFEFIQKIEIPEFILDKLDGRDNEDNKRPSPSLQ